MLAVAATGCSALLPGSDDEAQSGPGGGDLVIGVAQPLTGPVADAGQSVAAGAKIAAEEINKAGGVDGRKIRLDVQDDANDPATCVNVAQKLVNQSQATAVMGGWGSSCTLAISPVTSRAQVPLLVETSSSDKVTDPKESGNDWTFRISPTSNMEAHATRDLLREEGVKKVFFLSVNNDFGLGAAKHYGELLTEAGVTNTGTAKFDQTAQSLSSQVTQAIGSGADTWVVTTDVAQIALLLKEAKGQNAKARIITTGGSNSPLQLLELAGESVAEGTYATTFFPFFDPSAAADPKGAAAFVAAWKAKGLNYGQITEGVRGYQGIKVIAEAMRAAKDPSDRTAVRDALTKVSTKGVVYGDIRFQNWQNLRNQTVPPVYLTRIDKGKVTLVGTGEPPY
ncbi:MAG: ABC transporter substrate-binding protein [Streptosporangiales bacterium]|nr:ABC transporter substrate-binding protein [Streptosporangiales bacterium]